MIARRAYGHRLLRNSNPVPAAHTSPHPQSPISGLVAYTTQPRQLYPRPKALPRALPRKLCSIVLYVVLLGLGLPVSFLRFLVVIDSWCPY